MKRRAGLVLLIFAVFFVMSFLTNIMGPIIPDLITDLALNLTLAGLLPFSFFIAYGVMSIPGGVLVERFGEKSAALGSFALAFVGALCFALSPSFTTALPSLFAIGAGMATLQVALNPLLRVAGGEEHFAFNSVLAQLVFGAASFLSPQVYRWLVEGSQVSGESQSALFDLLAAIVPAGSPWVALYWLIALVCLVMVGVITAVRFPDVRRTEAERVGAWETHRELFGNRTVILYFIGIFCYVGTEQGVADWTSQFLATYHGFDPHTAGASAVGWFWGLMTAGCLLGLLLLRLFDSRRVLQWFVAAAFLFLTAGLYGPAGVSRWAFPLVGFAASVMWSIVFSLALNSVDRHHGSFSGILCTGVIGGAVVPLFIGWLGDMAGLRTGMAVLYLTLGYLFSVGFWARPIISNATIGASAAS